MSSILIENGIVLTVNDTHDVFEPGYLYVENDRISALGAGEAPKDIKEKAKESIDANGFAVMPGMTNAHVHLQQTLVRGMSDDEGVIPWVYNVAFPVYMTMTPDEIFIAEMMGIVENLRGGATSVTNNLTVRATQGGFDACLRAGAESGIRYKLARGFNERNVPEQIMETQEEILGDMHRLYESYHNAENGRLLVDFNPHALAFVTAETLIKVYELSQDWGNGIHLHTAESAIEVDEWVKETGKRQVIWLGDLGVLGPNFQLAHSVHLDDYEIELVAETSTCIVHNPVSNAFTGAGIAPVLKLRKAGATVALGTDGQAVANGREMLDVLAWATNMQKAGNQDSIGLGADEVLTMACRDGSKAFGLPGQIGILDVGKKADVILVDLKKSRLTRPAKNISSLVVNFARGGDVETAIVDGKVLLRNGEITFIDENSLRDEFSRRRAEVLKRAGFNAQF
jgi:5-methylthioadenosine/S-adenosylhomocysteine deaminase